MASSDRGVPRGDHVPAPEQEESIREQQAENPTESKPDFSKGSDRGGSSGWGGESAGGSTFDKRTKEK